MTKAETLLNELRQYDLHQPRRKGYREELPSPGDSLFIRLGKIYALSDSDQREVIRNSVHDDSRLSLIGYSFRLATIAARTRNREFLLLALIAHSIEDFRHDNRENIIVLVLINHVARRLGEDLSNLVRRVTELSSERGARNLREFLDRPSQINTLKVMGIIEEETAEGVDYRFV